MSHVQCTVCRHPKVVEINGRLLAGEARARIAREYGLSDDAVGRHWAKHIPDAMRAAQDVSDGEGLPRLAVIEGEILLGQAGEILIRAKALLASLDRDDVDPRARVFALAEVRKSLESLAKLNVMVAEQGKGKIAASQAPEIDAAIVRALEERLGTSAEPDEYEQGFRELRALGPGSA